MDDCPDPIELLENIADLLALNGEPEWARRFDRLRAKWSVDCDEARTDAKALYGGMGSFSDLIIQNSDGVPVRANELLEAYRSQLYELCRPGWHY